MQTTRTTTPVEHTRFNNGFNWTDIQLLLVHNNVQYTETKQEEARMFVYSL